MGKNKTIDGDGVETFVRPDGTPWRVLVEQDEYPAAPEDDGGFPVLAMDRWSAQVRHTGYGYGYARDHQDAMQRALAWFYTRAYRGDAVDMFRRYLAAFHDGSLVTYGPNNVTNDTCVAFETATLREAWGASERAEPDMGEWISYLEGDVWVVREERGTFVREVWEDAHTVRVERADGPLDPNNLPEGVSIRWVEEESTFGYYGREYAVEEAQSRVESARAN